MVNIFVKFPKGDESVVIGYDRRGHPLAAQWPSSVEAQHQVNYWTHGGAFDGRDGKAEFIIRQAQ